MKKNLKISPIGLKGNQINERMKELMGISTITESKSNISVELTKVGPDGNAYAIIRENHEWYIKTTDKKKGLVAEDFKYIGGLQNKKSEAYPSYAKAIKHLNMKFKSLAEAYNFTGEINVFQNDNLLNETEITGFSDIDETISLYEEEGEEETAEEEIIDDVALSEEEEAIDAMLETDSEEVPENPEDYTKQPSYIHENKLMISRAMSKMDSIIDNLTEGNVKKKVYTIK